MDSGSSKTMPHSSLWSAVLSNDPMGQLFIVVNILFSSGIARPKFLGHVPRKLDRSLLLVGDDAIEDGLAHCVFDLPDDAAGRQVEEFHDHLAGERRLP